MRVRLWLSAHRWQVAAAAAIVAIIAIAIVSTLNSAARYNRASYATSVERLLAEYPWLAQPLGGDNPPAPLALAYDSSGGPPGYKDLGAFPIGNGRALGIVGLNFPATAICNLIGPNYQKQGGFFGTLTIALASRRRAVSLPQAKVLWLSDAPVVWSRMEDPKAGSLQVWWFAAPDVPALVFIAAISAPPGRGLPAASLVLTSNQPAAELRGDAIFIQRAGRCMMARLLGARGQRIDPLLLPQGLSRRIRPYDPGVALSIAYPLGTVRPSSSIAKIGCIAFGRSAAECEQALRKVASAGFEIVEAARQAWKEWSRGLCRVQTGDAAVDGYLRAQEYIIRAQQADAGGFSPMHGYTYCWVRDSVGPVRFLSRIGQTRAVAKHLEYHFRACAKLGRVGNNVPLDVDVSGHIGQVNWAKIPVERAEVPSYVILQHWWYYLASGDATLIRWHWPMLRRCLLGQQLSADGTLPFHGDETYRFPGYELFAAGQPVDDWVCLDQTRSADSAFLFVAAAEAMAEMASRMGLSGEAAEYSALASRVRQATEAIYFQTDKGIYAPAKSDFCPLLQQNPFGNINLRPLWVGYAEAADSKQIGNVLRTLAFLTADSGRIKTTPRCGYFTGMLPGFAVWDLAELRHPAVKQAVAGLLSAAEPGGGAAEMNEPDGRPADDVWGFHRCRPWEGGINADAVFYALTGLRVDAARRRVTLRPLLLWSDEMRIEGIAVGTNALLVEARRRGNRVRYRIEAAGEVAPNPPIVDLQAVLPGFAAKLVRVEPAGEAVQQQVRRWPWAVEVDVQGLAVQVGKPVVVEVELSPMAGAGWPEPRPFSWSPPPAPRAPVLVITHSREAFGQARQRHGACDGLDTKIAFPASFLRAMLLDGGRPRYRLVVLDVDRFAGAFKPKDFWTKGEGAKILADFQRAGGQVVKAEKQSPPPQPRAGLPGLG